MPFPDATGCGVRIAVIDSGVNNAHPHIPVRAQTVLIGALEGTAQEDTLGHGTAVMAAIQEKAPEAEYFAIKLFGSSLRTTTGRLIEAIEWAIENRMDVINLSLGTTKSESWAEFQNLVNRGWAQGTVLVSARDAGVRPLLPGSLSGVIGVDVDWDLSRNRYRVTAAGSSCQFFASGYPRPLPGIPAVRNLNGISFAVANMTGFVARALEGLRDRAFGSLRDALATESRAEVAQAPGTVAAF